MSGWRRDNSQKMNMPVLKLHQNAGASNTSRWRTLFGTLLSFQSLTHSWDVACNVNSISIRVLILSLNSIPFLSMLHHHPPFSLFCSQYASTLHILYLFSLFLSFCLCVAWFTTSLLLSDRVQTVPFHKVKFMSSASRIHLRCRLTGDNHTRRPAQLTDVHPWRNSVQITRSKRQ
jgi:hypothetical protein